VIIKSVINKSGNNIKKQQMDNGKNKKAAE
jgi:hypothetical protein